MGTGDFGGRMNDTLIIDDNRSTADALHQMLTVVGYYCARGVWRQPGNDAVERL